MTVTVKIDVTNHPTRQVDCWDGALEAIRFTFNPSLSDDVTTLKALAAAFITQCDKLAMRSSWCGREMSVAKTNMQTASMWAVLGATKSEGHQDIGMKV